jgi:hypothetical protein
MATGIHACAVLLTNQNHSVGLLCSHGGGGSDDHHDVRFEERVLDYSIAHALCV